MWLLDKIDDFKTERENRYFKEMDKKYGDCMLETDDFKFIWGIKSWDDLTGHNASMYTMNYIDITYDKKNKVYILGVETAYKVYEVLNGLQVCFPKRFFTKEYTKEMIISGYSEGTSVQALSKQFGLTERRIRQMISEEKAERSNDNL